jgi:hypothetical protein
VQHVELAVLLDDLLRQASHPVSQADLGGGHALFGSPRLAPRVGALGSTLPQGRSAT